MNSERTEAQLDLGLINLRSNRIVARFESRELARLCVEALIRLNPEVRDAIAIERLQASGSGATATTPPYRAEAVNSPPEMAKPPKR